jgi:hypothetical protein
VIANAEANDRLVLSSDGPALDRKQWRAKPSLAPEFLPVLDRIKTLATGGLTSMHVVSDFLKRWIAPLQRRVRLCCWFTGSNDIGWIQRRTSTDLSWEELELLVKGITSESFIPESLILPQGIPALCDEPGLRTAILASLPTLDESGVAVRQTGGRDPHRGIRISDAPAGGPQPAGAGSKAPPWPLASLTRVKGLQVAPPPWVAPWGRRKRGDAGCVVPTDRLSRILPLFQTCPRSVRGPLAGPRRPAPRPRTRRGASVLLHHHHRIRCHRHHHHRRSRHHHHHLGVISPRSTSSNDHSSSSNNNSSGRPASRVAGRSRAPSKCSPILVFASVVIIPTSLNPSFACQGFLPLCSQGRASSAGYHARRRV